MRSRKSVSWWYQLKHARLQGKNWHLLPLPSVPSRALTQRWRPLSPFAGLRIGEASRPGPCPLVAGYGSSTLVVPVFHDSVGLYNWINGISSEMREKIGRSIAAAVLSRAAKEARLVAEPSAQAP